MLRIDNNLSHFVKDINPSESEILDDAIRINTNDYFLALLATMEGAVLLHFLVNFGEYIYKYRSRQNQDEDIELNETTPLRDQELAVSGAGHNIVPPPSYDTSSRDRPPNYDESKSESESESERKRKRYSNSSKKHY